jgi:hypothetical protein
MKRKKVKAPSPKAKRANGMKWSKNEGRDLESP